MCAIKATLAMDNYKIDEDSLTLSMFARTCKKKNNRIYVRMPIKKNTLHLVLFELGRVHTKQYYLEIMYKTAYLFAYYGMLRVGELTTSEHVLRAKDVHSANNKARIKIILYSSKTHGRGDPPQQIDINACKDIFCPFLLAKEYSNLRPKYNTDSDQYFVFSDGSPLTSKLFRQTLRLCLSNLKLDSKCYDTHSFRIGRATDLRKEGHKVEEIKRQGRWKSNCVYKYLRE